MNEQSEELQTERELELSVSGREENDASHQESRMKLSLKKKKKWLSSALMECCRGHLQSDSLRLQSLWPPHACKDDLSVQVW